MTSASGVALRPLSPSCASRLETHPPATNHPARHLEPSGKVMWREVVEVCRKQPMLTGTLVATAKGVLADVSSQAIMQRDEPYNSRRTISFALWNGLYCGIGVFLLYSVLLPRIWPTRLATGAWHPLARRHIAFSVGFDNLFATPCLCLPTYYACNALVQSSRQEIATRPAHILAGAMRTYLSEARETLRLSLGIWIPVHLLTFTVVPVELRTHWVATCSFLSLSFMSLLQASLEKRRPLS